MFAPVTIPAWLLAGLVLLAGVAVLDRLLLPSVRWYLRRRLNRAIERLNARLQLRIQPFKLTRRKVMIDRLVHDPKVMEAVAEHARQHDMPLDAATALAERYAREIVPAFSVLAYFGVATRLARALSRALYRVRVGFVADEDYARVDPDSTVIFVMNHRSNMDYVLVTWLASERSALSYAVGEWARVWPLKQLIGALGAYFVRRRSRNPLYRRVLARYVQMATEGGVSQAMFPEGGLSVDGRLQAPKLGLLSYVVDAFDPKGTRDVVFVPVGLNYDRVLEDRVLTAVDPEGKRRFDFRPAVALRFVLHQIWLRMTGRFYRFGYACVSFGRPLSLRAFLKDNPGLARDQTVARLGETLIAEVGRVIPVLPVPLVAEVLLAAPAPLTRLDIKARAHELLQGLDRRVVHVHIPRGDFDYAIEVGLRALHSRHLIAETDGLFRPADGGQRLLSYYANSIAHLLPESQRGNKITQHTT